MDSKKMSSITDDLYELLGCPSEATKNEVVKAYRKKALACHPDKNPNNPKAAEEFIKISAALEILTDDSAKASYDRLRQARLKARERHRHLDAKRRKMKEELEAREKSATAKHHDEASAMQNFQNEIDRLREEGSALLKAEQEALRKRLQEERLFSAAANGVDLDPADPMYTPPSCSFPPKTDENLPENQSSMLKLKLRWKKSSEGIDYDAETLSSLFSKYGPIAAVVVSTKKKRTALIEFMTPDAAVLALETEKGYPENPLVIEILGMASSGSTGPSVDSSGASSPLPPNPLLASKFEQQPPSEPPVAPSTGYSSFPTPNTVVLNPELHSSTRSERDFESIVLMKLRREEERKRLIQEMENDDCD